MKGIALMLACLPVIASAAPARLCPTTVLGDERLVLGTTLGEIAIGLYAPLAPRHAAAVSRLAQAGVYDGTPFFKVLPRFAVQLAGVRRRAQPLTADQTAMVRPLDAELNACPHRRGTVTMAHDPDDVNSAQTSFLIMLGDVPRMNGKFTVIGEVTRGWEVLDTLEGLPTNPATGEPLRRVEVIRAAVRRETAAPALSREPEEALPRGFAISALVLFAVGQLSRRRWRRPSVRAGGLLAILGGAFGLFVWFGPRLSATPNAGLPVFAAAFLLFRLLSRFEDAPA